jgi:hypothetical protein
MERKNRNMKKTYQKPYVQLVVVNIENTILAGSPGAVSEGYNPSSESLSYEENSLWNEL